MHVPFFSALPVFRSLGLSLLTIGISACIAIPIRATRGELGRKTVTSKDPPRRLIAHDGARCIVSEGRFQQVLIGQRVWCHWTADMNASARRRLRPNKRLKLAARVDYGMSLFSARRSLSAIR
jgi:hypothetical protein